MILARVAALLLASAPAVAAGQTIEVVGATEPIFRTTDDRPAPQSASFPVLLPGGADPMVHVQLVQAAHDDQPMEPGAYTACLAPPSAGQSLWTLRIGGAGDAFAAGTHALSLLAWRDDRVPSRATACGEDGRPSAAAPPPAQGCPSAYCGTVALSVTVDAPAERDGPLVRLVGPAQRVLPFDRAEARLAALDYPFSPGRGVAPETLGLVVVDVSSDGRDIGPGFDICVAPAGARGDRLPRLRLTPRERDLPPGTYSVTAHAFVAGSGGSRCSGNAADPRPPRPYDPDACKAAAAAGEALQCQVLSVQVSRKAAKLQAPAGIAINIRRFPILEWLPVIGDRADLRRHATPLRIAEVGYEGAADLSATVAEVAVTQTDDPTDTGTVTFAVDDGAPSGAPLGMLAPGGAVTLVPLGLDLPGGYGSYAGALTLQAVEGAADSRTVAVTVTVAMSTVALVLAIALGVFLGYLYRRTLEDGIVIDRALIEARRSLQKLERTRDAAQDATLIPALQAAIDELLTAMHSQLASGSGIDQARQDAEAAAKQAQDDLAARLAEAAERLEPWLTAFAPAAAEPAGVETALAPARRHLKHLRALLDRGDATRATASDGLDLVPARARASLAGAEAWLAGYDAALGRVPERWAVLSQDLGEIRPEIARAQAALAAAAASDRLDAQAAGEALGRLGSVLRSCDIVLRRQFVGLAGRFADALAAEADLAGLDPAGLRAARQALAAVAASPGAAWPVAAFERAALALHAAVAAVAKALIAEGRLGAGPEPATAAEAVQRAVEHWQAVGLAGAAADREAGDAEALPSAPAYRAAYRIVPPRTVYHGEPAFWHLEADMPAAPPPTDVAWRMGAAALGRGSPALLTLAASGVVTAEFRAGADSGTAEQTVTVVGSARPLDIAGLERRVARSVALRTLVNGVLITIFGVVVLNAFGGAGYPSLVAAFAYGLAADLSADTLATVLSRRPAGAGRVS